MSEIFKTKKKLPFSIVSSSVKTGYNSEISSSFRPNIDIANLHGDNYSSYEDAPAQGPFTEAHVGGNKHRHAPLNAGDDDASNRAEAFLINLDTPGELRVYGPETVDTAYPRASMLRGNAAKSPLNLSNIQSTTGSALLGNYKNEYEVLQTSGRTVNNRFIKNDGEIAVLNPITFFVTGAAEYTLPSRENTETNKFIFVERFNAPGGFDVSSRGMLDRAAEEMASNNALPFRNLKVRLSLRNSLSEHTVPATGLSGSLHKVNRNTLRRPSKSDDGTFTPLYDNGYVNHPIPQSDLQYSWITSSAITTMNELLGYQHSGSHLNKAGAFTDISFSVSGSVIDDDTLTDHLNIRGFNKNFHYINKFDKTLEKDRSFFVFDGQTQTFPGAGQHTNAIDLGNTSLWNHSIGTLGSKKFTLSIWFNLTSFSGSVTTPRLFDFSNEMYLALESGSNNRIDVAFMQDTTGVHVSYFTNSGSAPNIDFGTWHHAVLTFDGTQITSSTPPILYLDGAKVLLQNDDSPTGDMSSFASFANCFVGNRRSVSSADLPFSGSLSEISIWNDVLTEEEQGLLYLATKPPNNIGAPLNYREHKIDQQYPSMRRKLVSWWSGSGRHQRNNVISANGGGSPKTGIFIEDVAGINNYHAAMGSGVTKQKVGITSLSFNNGPYQHPIWKQIRTGETPVARFLRHANIITVQDEPILKEIVSNGKRRVIKPKRSSTSTSFVEPPVSSKYKPIKHNLMLKGTVNPLLGHEITHTYANNLSMFANKSLNQRLKIDRLDKQMYDRLVEFYLDSDLPEEDNPIARFLNLIYKETIFPKEENTFLGKTRSRQKYILDLSGFSSEGYDKTFGSQRVFWRDHFSDRQRTVNKAINSQGFIISSSLGGTSAYPIDLHSAYLTSSALASSSVQINTGIALTSQEVIKVWNSPSGSGELNAYAFLENNREAFVSSIPAMFYSDTLVDLDFLSNFHHYTQSFGSLMNTTGTFPLTPPRAKYLCWLGGYTKEFTDEPAFFDSFNSHTKDSGIINRVNEQAGKNSWFDSYEDYSQDIRLMGQDMSLIPEFRMSEHMEFYVETNGGNFRKKNNKFLSIDGGKVRNSALTENTELDLNFSNDYVVSDKIRFIDGIKEEHGNIAKVANISLKCKGIKKLLPYNGFYPITRTLQLANLFSQSYGSSFVGGYDKLEVSSSAAVNFLFVDTNEFIENENSRMKAALAPFFAPGIMYNTIKSGIAVDFPVYTGSLSTPTGAFQVYTFPRKYEWGIVPNYRFPFEAIITPSAYLPRSSSTDSSKVQYQKADFFFHTGNVVSREFFKWTGIINPLYDLASSNFFAETVKFFLKDEKLTTFSSAKETEWGQTIFNSSKTYYMDVVIEKTSDLVMMEAYNTSSHYTVNPEPQFGTFEGLGTKNGRYFGFPMSTQGNPSVAEAYDDPCYAAYTPPYFEGASFARISFSPTSTRAFSLEEIFASSSISYTQGGFENMSQTSTAYSSSMRVSSSVNIFGVSNIPKVTYDEQGNIIQIVEDQNKRWVISSRTETPVLDFSSQPFEQDLLYSASAGDARLAATGSHDNQAHDPNQSGYGRGMWSGYGTTPAGSKGIFLRLRESFPEQSENPSSTTASLLQVMKFSENSSLEQKIGELADVKEISEAIIAIPYVKTPTKNTVEILGKNFIKIDRNIFDSQRERIKKGQTAVGIGVLSSKEDIAETSISKMISTMNKHVMPPHYDFLQFNDIEPFVAYTFEFRHNLDKQDLADIWQGVMPKIAIVPEKDEIEFSHPSNKFEFFHGEEMPDGLRWMVFKVKKKSEKNYFAVTADSSDDSRYSFDFEVGRKAPEYSYNWPYDYFSLVELANLEVEIEYENNNEIEKIRQGNIRGLDTQRPASSQRGSSNKGKKV